jgi:DNA-directed RNA polymerase specialized sigma24 family protein
MDEPKGSVGSVTGYLDQCKAGDPGAVSPLWERYFPRLAALGEHLIRGQPWAAWFDGEDAALSAFDNFWQAVSAGCYPELANRNELWALLTTILRHKVRDRVKQACRDRRDVRRHQAGSPDLDRVLDPEPSPDQATLMEEECRRLLDRLGDDKLRQVALLKVRGHTDQEVAAALGCGLRTVERKLERIRLIWSKEGER